MNYEASPDLGRQRPEGKGIKSEAKQTPLCRKLQVAQSPRSIFLRNSKDQNRNMFYGSQPTINNIRSCLTRMIGYHYFKKSIEIEIRLETSFRVNFISNGFQGSPFFDFLFKKPKGPYFKN